MPTQRPAVPELSPNRGTPQFVQMGDLDCIPTVYHLADAGHPHAASGLRRGVRHCISAKEARRKGGCDVIHEVLFTENQAAYECTAAFIFATDAIGE